jgi:hypothetical protein
VRRWVRHQRDVPVGKPRLQALHDGDGRIGRIPNPEHNLKLRIFLLAQRRQCPLQQRLVAIERLQNRHR